MFNYINIPYSDKINKLLVFHGNSSKLKDYLEVSRGSIVKWKEDDSAINNDNKLKIDVAYCEAFGFTEITTNDIDKMYDELSKIDFSYFNTNEDILVQQISKISAFGSLEIEEDNITEKMFNKVVESKELIKNLNQRELFSIKNLASLNDKVINDTIKDNLQDIDTRAIKQWHYNLMTGIRSDAGEYSTNHRIIPNSQEIILTDPRDISEELERWTTKYTNVKTLRDIAMAHSHFELIHPFGDGNGRIGRMIIAIHSIKAGYIPPMINKSNKALYYVFLKDSQITSEYGYLSYFIGQSILSMHNKFFR